VCSSDLVQARRGLQGRTSAIQHKVRVAGSGTVGNNRHRLVGRVGGVILDFHIQNGGQATQPLGANAQLVHLLKQLQTQFFSTIGGTTGLQIVNIDRVQQSFFRQ